MSDFMPASTTVTVGNISLLQFAVIQYACNSGHIHTPIENNHSFVDKEIIDFHMKGVYLFTDITSVCLQY